MAKSTATQPEAQAAGHAAPRHWRLERDGQGIAWLTLDRAGADTNALGEAVLEELDARLEELEAEPPRGLVVRSGKPAGFAVGADLDEFADLTEPAKAEAKVRRAQAVFDRLEGLACPAVALIHGHCLGGGLEMALACRTRIARDDAQLGLPEVRLGIHPGFGGTARLTRLLPAPVALDLMLTGRSVRAASARRMGLVDAVTQERHMAAAARHAVAGGLRVRRGGAKVRGLNAGAVRPLVARMARRKVAARARPEHYPAPFALVDLWARHGGDRWEMQGAEARSVAELITGETSRNLQRLFFLRRRLKGLGREAGFAPRHVHVVGAGTMGGDIAAWCARRGLTVTLQDRGAEFIGPAIARADRLFAREFRDRARERAAHDRLIPDLRGDGLGCADVVVEAIVEDVEAKRALFREVEPRLKEGTLIGTNTSSIPPERLAETLARPERLVGVHFFNPVARMPLVEIVAGANAGAEARARALAFAAAIDRLPLPVASGPGFLVNRVLTPYLLEAARLIEEGFEPAAVDAAAEAFGMPMGPLELGDRVGLDVCLSVGRFLAGELGLEVPDRLARLVEEGRTGRKAGAGFYDYRKGKPQKAKLRGEPDREVQDRLVLPLYNAAVASLREGVVTDADLLDAGMVFGAGFAPFRGGPMRDLRARGAEDVRARLAALAERHGERFRPDAGWDDPFGEARAAPAGADADEPAGAGAP